MLTGAISFSSRVDAGLIVERLSAHSCRSQHQRAQVLWKDEGFACTFIDRPSSSTGRPQHWTGSETWTCLSGNIPWSPGRIEALLRAPESTPTYLGKTLPGHWAGLRYNSSRAVWELFNDRLGIGWTYVAKLPWGYAFGPDFGALVAAADVPRRPDHGHIITTLALGYAFDESTCLEGVRLLPAGAVLRISREGEELESNAVRYPEVDRGDASARARAYGEVLSQAAQTWIEPGLSETDISLSAGLDCRYGLGLMLEAGHRPNGFTFGHPNSGEVRQAKRVARSAGVSTQVFEIGPSRWEGWRRCVAQSGAVGGFHWPDWTGWLDFLAARSNRILIGFLGDAFSGKHWVPAADDSVSANVHAWSKHNVDLDWMQSDLFSAPIRQDVAAQVQASVDGFAASATYAEGFQAQLHLDWYGRQRRFTAAQPNLMHCVVDVVPFLYAPEMMDFWAAVPPSDLLDQGLYRQYAAKRFPSLFSPATSRPTLSDRISGSARNALASMGPWWKRRFAPIVLDPEGMIVEQKQPILATLRAAADCLSEIVNMETLYREVEMFPRPGGLNAMQVRRLVNVAILLNTASEAPANNASEVHADSVAQASRP